MNPHQNLLFKMRLHPAQQMLIFSWIHSISTGPRWICSTLTRLLLTWLPPFPALGAGHRRHLRVLPQRGAIILEAKARCHSRYFPKRNALVVDAHACRARRASTSAHSAPSLSGRDMTGLDMRKAFTYHLTHGSARLT